jgi:hypothetical protein
LRPPIAKVSANVKIHDPKVTRRLGDDITFVIHIPLSIDLLHDLRLDKQRFVVSGAIALSATARATEPLLLIVDVEKPRPSDITVNVSSKSFRGELYVRRRRVCQCNVRDRLTRSDKPWLE